MLITIHTDGACRGNPGPGGWAAIICAYDDFGNLIKMREACGFDRYTTNNKMELRAVIGGLMMLMKPGQKLTVYSDSKYVLHGIERWIHNWKRMNWRKLDGSPVLNQELWRELDRLSAEHEITWQWVRGHSGNELNERADKLACEQRDHATKRAA